MADKPLSLQDRFLNAVRRSKSPATIFLVKGVKLQGAITWFDPFSLLLRRDGNSQLVYKHSISTIVPMSMPAGFSIPADTPDQRAAAGRSLQDIFLSAARAERQSLTLFLINGVMLQGRVAGYDQFSVLLERAGQMQIVYKHAISTLQPDQPLNLADRRGGDSEDLE